MSENYLHFIAVIDLDHMLVFSKVKQYDGNASLYQNNLVIHHEFYFRNFIVKKLILTTKL